MSKLFPIYHKTSSMPWTDDWQSGRQFRREALVLGLQTKSVSKTWSSTLLFDCKRKKCGVDIVTVVHKCPSTRLRPESCALPGWLGLWLDWFLMKTPWFIIFQASQNLACSKTSFQVLMEKFLLLLLRWVRTGYVTILISLTNYIFF